MLSNCLKHCFEQQRDIWCKGSSDAKVLAFFSAKSEWRETTRRFRPLQTAAVGLSGVYVNVACMLKFGAEFNCGVPVRMKPNGFLCSRTERGLVKNSSNDMRMAFLIGNGLANESWCLFELGHNFLSHQQFESFRHVKPCNLLPNYQHLPKKLLLLARRSHQD